MEKVVFENIYQKLAAEMNKKKERLIKIIKRAENAYSDKEQMVNELQSLKKESQREQEEFEKECDKLNQMMLKDR